MKLTVSDCPLSLNILRKSVDSDFLPLCVLLVAGFHSYFPREGGQLSVFAKLRLGYTALTAPTFSPLEVCTVTTEVVILPALHLCK